MSGGCPLSDKLTCIYIYIYPLKSKKVEHVRGISTQIMIQYLHLNIQFFTTLSMWQGGSPLLFEFFFFLK